MQGKSKIIWLGLAVFVAAQRWLDTFCQLLNNRSLGRFLRPASGRSRGDVPGWVLITLMSAVLVAGLLAIAGPALERLFNQAMEQVQP